MAGGIEYLIKISVGESKKELEELHRKFNEVIDSIDELDNNPSMENLNKSLELSRRYYEQLQSQLNKVKKEINEVGEANITDNLAEEYRVLNGELNAMDETITALSNAKMDALYESFKNSETEGEKAASMLAMVKERVAQTGESTESATKSIKKYISQMNLAAVAAKAKAAILNSLKGGVVALAALLGKQLVSALVKVYKNATESTRRLKEMKESLEQASASSFAEVQRLASLESRLNSLAKGTKEYNAVKQEIISTYGKYNDQLSAEIERTGNLSTVYADLAKNIVAAANAKAYNDEVTKTTNNLAEKSQKELEKLQKRLIKGLGEDEGLAAYSSIVRSITSGVALDDKAQAQIAKFDKYSQVQTGWNTSSGTGVQAVYETRKTGNEIEKIVAELSKNVTKYQKEIDRANKIFAVDQSSQDSLVRGLGDNIRAWAEEYNAAANDLYDITSNIGQHTQQEYQLATERYEAAKKTYSMAAPIIEQMNKEIARTAQYDLELKEEQYQVRKTQSDKEIEQLQRELQTKIALGEDANAIQQKITQKQVALINEETALKVKALENQRNAEIASMDGKSQAEKNAVKKHYDDLINIAKRQGTAQAQSIVYSNSYDSGRTAVTANQMTRELKNESAEYAIASMQAEVDALEREVQRKKTLNQEYINEEKTILAQKKEIIDKQLEITLAGIEQEKQAKLAELVSGSEADQAKIEQDRRTLEALYAQKAQIATQNANLQKDNLDSDFASKQIAELTQLISTYQSYTDKKAALDAQYLQDKKVLEEAYAKTGDEVYKRSLDERVKAYNSAILNLEMQQKDGVLKTIFRDASTLVKDELVVSLSLAQSKLKELQESGNASVQDMAVLQEQIDKLQEALINIEPVDFDATWEDVAAQIKENTRLQKLYNQQVDKSSEGAKDLASRLAKGKENLSAMIKGAGLNLLTSGLSTAADAMSRLAEASEDPRLADMAKNLSAASDTLSAAISGFATGGLLGAIIGGGVSLIKNGINSIIEEEVAAIEAKKAIDEITRSVGLMNLELKNSSSLFGNFIFSKGADAFKKMSDASSRLQDTMSKLRQEYANARRTIAQTTQDTTSLFYRLNSLGITLQEATTQYSRGSALTLEQQLRVLEEFYETVKDKNEKETLRDLIDSLKAQLEAEKALDDSVSNFTSGLAGSLADAIWDGVVLGGEDAWEQWNKIGADAIAKVGKQMLQELIMGSYLDNFNDRLKASMGTGSAETFADVMNDIIDGFPAIFNQASEAALAFKSRMEAEGINFDNAETETEEDRTARAKGLAAMSQDSANELNGRFTEMQISMDNIDSTTRAIREQQDAMFSRTAEILIELQGIHNDTTGMRESLAGMDDNISMIKSDIKQIATSGVIMQ